MNNNENKNNRNEAFDQYRTKRSRDNRNNDAFPFTSEHDNSIFSNSDQERSRGDFSSQSERSRVGEERHSNNMDRNCSPRSSSDSERSAQDRSSQNSSGSCGYSTGEDCSGRGPRSYSRSDERIKEEVCETLTRDRQVDCSEIDVNVKQGVITLQGTVKNKSDKRRVEDICDDVLGAKEVNNQLRTNKSDSSKSNKDLYNGYSNDETMHMNSDSVDKSL